MYAEVVYFLHDSVYLLVIRQRCHQLVAVVFGKRLAFIFRSTASSLDHLAETYKGHFLLAVLSLREHNPFNYTTSHNCSFFSYAFLREWNRFR